jgi:branched-chain amino acid transport system permease protein
VGIIFGIIAAVLLSLVTEPLFRPLTRRGAQLGSFIVAMAIGTIITEILARNLNKGIVISFPEELTGGRSLITFGISAISIGQIATVAGSIVAGGLFFYILFKTKQGRAFRAIGQDSYNSRLLGLPILRIGLLVYTIAGLMGGISAIFLAMSLETASASLGNNLAIKIMAIALFSGLGNIGGGILAALILGFAESMALAYLPGTYSQAIAFAMIMIIVMVKPQGLFGTKA